jgi:radical SAM protein with 4Fe4S-binding SPASM domain
MAQAERGLCERDSAQPIGLWDGEGPQEDGFVRLINKLMLLRQVLTPTKVFNLALKEIHYFLGNSTLFYLPNRVIIDIGNVCNLKCPLCPTGRGDKGASRGLMKFEDYKKIIDQMGKTITNLELHNWGEPLLNRELIPMIQYAKDRNIPVCISTNLTILDEKMAEDIVATRIDKMFISCDAASPETYSTYRVGGDFHRVISNIRLLTEAKKKLKNNYTRIVYLFHVFRHNEHEIEKARALAKELGVEVRINKMRTDMGKEIFEKDTESIERDMEWIPESDEYSAFDLVSKKKKQQTRCRDLWSTTVINWDGSVLPCCAVYEEKYAFGNVFDEPFRSIWNNERYQMARREIRNKVKNSHTVCHICKQNEFMHF